MSGSILAYLLTVANQRPCRFCPSGSKQFAFVHKQLVSFIPLTCWDASVFYSPICHVVIIHSSDCGGCFCMRKCFVFLPVSFLFTSTTTLDQVRFLSLFMVFHMNLHQSVEDKFKMILLIITAEKEEICHNIVLSFLISLKTKLDLTFSPGSGYLFCRGMNKNSFQNHQQFWKKGGWTQLLSSVSQFFKFVLHGLRSETAHFRVIECSCHRPFSVSYGTWI